MLFSIVTVCYNADKLIEHTIKSVLSQDFSDFEYIVIDGESTDETLEIIKKFEHKISYWISEKDSGIYNAMNKAVRICHGEWVLFLNAGDIFSSSNILEMVSKICKNDIDLIYGDRHRISETGVRKFESAGKLDDVYYKEVVFHQSLFTRTKLLIEHPYDESFKLAADYAFILFALKSDKKFFYINISISDFLEGGRSRKNYLLAQIEAIKASIHFIPDMSKIRNNFYLEHIVLQNMVFYINRCLQQTIRENPNFKLTSKSNGNSILLKVQDANFTVTDLVNRINGPLSVPNITGHILPTANSIYRMLKRLIPGTIKNKILAFISPPKKEVQFTTTQPTAITRNIKVSVVTVCYNSHKELKETINSVLSHNYKNIEYIIIDGASTDETSSILNYYKSQISLIVSEPDNGIYYAMNKAIDFATGDYLLYLNAGDCFFDNEVLNRVFSDKRILSDLIYGARIYKKSDNTRIYQEARSLETVFSRMPYCHQSLLLKTSILKNFRFNTTYRFAADYEQSVRLFLAGCTYSKLEEPICIFMEGGASESGIRPYLETLKILFDNCNNKDEIKKSIYFSAFSRNVSKLLEI